MPPSMTMMVGKREFAAATAMAALVCLVLRRLSGSRDMSAPRPSLVRPRSEQRNSRPSAMPAASASNQELASLFLGDKLSAGYYSAVLVREVCRRENPQTFERLRAFFYGASTPINAIDPDAIEVLEDGYEWWDADGRPRAKA